MRKSMSITGRKDRAGDPPRGRNRIHRVLTAPAVFVVLDVLRVPLPACLHPGDQ